MKQMNPGTLSTDSKHLFDYLCTETMLLRGWREVKRNRGSSGIDGVTIEKFATTLQEEIKQLRQELLD